ncbi:MAG: hypothetical protein QXP01_06740, partial [Candidatus Hadarchaeum sp.]
MTFLAQPNEGSGEVQEAQVALGELVKPGEDPAVVLDLVDEAFHHMPFAVEMGVIETSLFSISPSWNNWYSARGLDLFNQVIRIIAF